MPVFSTQCCGVGDFQGLRRGAKATLEDVHRGIVWKGWGGTVPKMRKGAVMLTEASRGGKGKLLEKIDKYIKENELGSTTITDYFKNPNSPNKVRVMIFVPNKSFIKHFKVSER